MAKIWFLKPREVHEGKFVTDKPLDFCFDVLGLRVRNWHSPLERNEPLIIGSKAPNIYVVVEVTSRGWDAKPRIRLIPNIRVIEGGLSSFGLPPRPAIHSDRRLAHKRGGHSDIF